MRYNIRAFIEACAKTFDLKEPIIEIGSFQVPGQEEIAELRPLFKGKKYIGCDMRQGKGVDRIENVENLSFEDESIGTIIMLDTLEHVENPFNALKEIYRVLKPEGVVIMSSVMDFPIHDYPYDYWRFTPEAFRVFLKKFPTNIIGYSGNPKKPHTVIGIGFKLKDEINRKNFEEFKKILEHNKEFNTSISKNLRKRMNNVLIKILELLNPNKNIECVKFVFEEK